MVERIKLSEQFMIQFNGLKGATNNNPKTLLNFFSERPTFRNLVSELFLTAESIELFSSVRKIHLHVSPIFLELWKDYLNRWRMTVEYVHKEPLLRINLFDEVSLPPISFEEFSSFQRGLNRDEADPNYDESFDPKTHDGGAAIEKMMDLARERLEYYQSMPDFDSDQKWMANAWNIGIEAFEFLESKIGLNLSLVFDRWNKVPTIFVPKHVSDRHSLTEKDSLYRLLSDAIRAYVAGAPAASVAICRAALEIVLRDHYLKLPYADKSSLYEVINLAVARYRFLPAIKLHEMRTLANKILHDYAESDSLSVADEKQLIAFLNDLKFYIEKAPK